jgi:hypothetical protein
MLDMGNDHQESFYTIKETSEKKTSIIQNIKTENNKSGTVKVTPLKAIKLHCLECVGFIRSEVLLCTSSKCSLFPYRTGKNGRRSGIGGRKVKKGKLS